MNTPTMAAPSVNARAARIVETIAANASALRCAVSTGEAGERRIDLGAHVPGGLEAGRLLGEVCMGGLGTVALPRALTNSLFVSLLTTAIVQAVCAGVQPIYLAPNPSEMSIDPLYQLDEWRQSVSNTQAFKKLVEDSETNGSQDVSKKLTAIQYCESFYSPYDSSVVFAHVI